MQSCTWHLDGKRFESSPPELLLASLGACAGHHAAEYLRARSLPVTGLHVYVTAEKDERPARLSSFRVEVDVPASIDERQRQGVWRAVKACLIHNTLTTTAAIEVKVSGAAQQIVSQKRA